MRVKDDVSEDDLSFVAAGVGFYSILALFPALAAAVSIYGMFASPSSVEPFFSHLTALPEAVREILTTQVSRLSSQRSSALTAGVVIGLLITLYSATKGTKAVMKAMNVAYDEPDERGFIRKNLVALALTLLVVLAGCVTLAVLVGVPSLPQALGLEAAWIQWVFTAVPWIVVAGIALATLAALYRFAPDRADPEWRWITPGASLALVLWLSGSALLSLYVANFGKYGQTYGSLATVVILLLWLYLSAYALILGAEVNAEIEHQTGIDTTTGDRRPMGRRGAHVADTLGEST